MSSATFKRHAGQALPILIALAMLYPATVVYASGQTLLAATMLVIIAFALWIYSSSRVYAYRYLFPGIAAALIFVVFPMLYTIAIGFTNYSSRNLLDFHRASRRLVRHKVADQFARQLENEWSPSVAFDGRRMHAAWLDFRSYNWDVYSARGNRGGTRYKASVRVDDSPNFERLNSSPALAYDDTNARLVLVWSDQRDREPDTNIFYATSSDGGATWSTPARLDDGDAGFDPDTGVASRQWQPDVSAGGGTACTAWQDDRLGNSDVFFTTSTDAGDTFAPAERVDDTGTGGSEQSRPDLALVGQGGRRMCVVVWEDDRDGTSDIYRARRPCPRR